MFNIFFQPYVFKANILTCRGLLLPYLDKDGGLRIRESFKAAAQPRCPEVKLLALLEGNTKPAKGV